jgi:hypothetical protein
MEWILIAYLTLSQYNILLKEFTECQQRCCSLDMKVENKYPNLTLLKSITMFCGSNNILKYSHVWTECGKYPKIFHGILLISHNIVMDLNNVMIKLEGNKE